MFRSKAAALSAVLVVLSFAFGAAVVPAAPASAAGKKDLYTYAVLDGTNFRWSGATCTGANCGGPGDVAPSGNFELLRDDSTVLASLPASSPATVALSPSDYTNHFVILRYAGDANYNPWRGAPQTLNSYIPTSFTWPNQPLTFEAGVPVITAKVDAGPYSYLLDGVQMSTYVDGAFNSLNYAKYANGEVTIALPYAARSGTHDYRFTLTDGGLFLGSTSGNKAINLPANPSYTVIENANFDTSRRVLDLTYRVGGSTTTPWTSASLNSYMSVTLDGESVPATGNYLSCNSNPCSKTVSTYLPDLKPGRHVLKVSYDSFVGDFGPSEATSILDIALYGKTAGYRVITDLGKVDTHLYDRWALDTPGEIVKPLNRPVVGAASTPSMAGYWLVATDGGIFSFGDAKFYGSTGNLKLNQPIVGMASTTSGNGYWFVASDGGVFSFGNAAFYGSTGAIKLNKPIVGMAATPSGKGYWLVASDGGIFAFGDAQFYGSTGALKLNKPIVGMAATPSGNGYWMVASDGGIFAFGDAQFYGSTGAIKLNQPIVGMRPSPTGKGYWFVAADGGMFAFGDAPFNGAKLPNVSGTVVGML